MTERPNGPRDGLLWDEQLRCRFPEPGMQYCCVYASCIAASVCQAMCGVARTCFQLHRVRFPPLYCFTAAAQVFVCAAQLFCLLGSPEKLCHPNLQQSPGISPKEKQTGNSTPIYYRTHGYTDTRGCRAQGRDAQCMPAGRYWSVFGPPEPP